ncbi:MAG: hypothetical protein HY287_08815 [Planctomycetes bacterium]|nr:hypothetical protein [Planctomycetota bacterium]MBI3834414.1 hypothetical protein [Planctomycetota bacterium]
MLPKRATLKLRVIVCACLGAAVTPAGIAVADPPQGSIIVWGNNPYFSAIQNVPAPNSGFIAVSAGDFHSLGLKADGSIVAWGTDLGYGTLDIPLPNTGFIAIAVDDVHNLGLKADGSIMAWGSDPGNYGVLDIPVPNSGFSAIAIGRANFALRHDGSIVAWGCPDDGGVACDLPVPNNGFVQISAGGVHGLGLKKDGSVITWGCSFNVPSPQLCDPPPPNTGFVAISAGAYHSLGLKADGSVVAWGNNSSGERNVPAPNAGFKSVSAGAYYSIGLKADGSIVAWGDNGFGQLNVPPPNSGFVAIAARFHDSFAVRVTGACCETNGAAQGCRDGVAQSECDDADETWTENATCIEVPCSCIPNCAGRECGDDGCGGSCGICNDGLFCNGVETCGPQGGCILGAPPCQLNIEHCDEATQQCEPNPIPTVSEWGLMVLLLVLLTGAKLAFRRRIGFSES